MGPSALRRGWFAAVAGVTGALTVWYGLGVVEPLLLDAVARPPARLLPVALGSGFLLGVGVEALRNGGMAAHRRRRVVLAVLLGGVLLPGLLGPLVDAVGATPRLPPGADRVLAACVLVAAYAAGYRERLFALRAGGAPDT